MKNNNNRIEVILKNRYRLQQAEFAPEFEEYKQAASEGFRKEGLPAKKDEFWRKTDWEKYLNDKLEAPVTTEQTDFVPENDRHFGLIDGKYHGRQNLLRFENGIIAGSLKAAAKELPDIFKKFFDNIVRPKFKNLSKLNTLLFEDGFFLYVPENVKEKDILKLENILTDAQYKTNLHTRNLIILENNSRVSLEITDWTSEQSFVFITDLTEIYLGENARLDYFRTQEYNDSSSLVNMIYSDNYGENSLLDGFIMTFNGEYMRNEVQSKLSGKSSDVSWNGIYLPEIKQKVDNRIFIEHDTTDAQSNQHFKGILKDQSQAFFNGYILVDRNAQQTNAYQQNANILLSREAKVSSMPFLEIYADDVACSHGSTTGQLDDEAIFYLQQRGIDPGTARQMILHSFIEEIIVKLPFDAWKEQAEKELFRKWHIEPEALKI